MHALQHVEWIGKMKFGSILLAIYGFFCMFGQFSLHGLAADCARKLYSEYVHKYPKEAKTLMWAFESSLNSISGLIVGLLAGLAIGVIIYIFVNSGIQGTKPVDLLTYKFVSLAKLKKVREEDYRDVITGCFLFTLYLGIYLGFTFIANPFFLSSYVDLLYGFVFAAICYQASELYIFFDRERKRRRDFFSDKDLQLKQFELEHGRWRNYLHLAIWMFTMLCVGVFFTGIYSWVSVMPIEMSSSPHFRLLILTAAIEIIVIIFGFFVGIVFQIMHTLGDIIDVIKEYEKHLLDVKLCGNRSVLSG